MTFQELNLLPQLLQAVEELGYVQPSPIQAQAIPPVLKGKDLIGCAQTGTGKTAAFAIPILQRLHGRVGKRHTPIRALVLTPTRELALQIKESFDQYGKYLELRHTVIFGGVGQAPQVEALQKGVDILVATPGRLNDLSNQGHIDLSGIEAFVLDEADRMLDMGFIHDVRKVIARLPEKRQTLLFSATMPQEIADLSRTILKSPVRVEVTPQSSTVDAIEQRLYKVDKGNKKLLLQEVLKDKSLDSVLVFTNTKHGADRVVKELGRAGIAAMAIHGNKGQTARIKALESFKSGAIRVLVATDIAARGIDVNELAAVVNYELPNVPETYVHRIGRTGRAGRGGVAVSFCNFDELAYLKYIEKLTNRKSPWWRTTPGPWRSLRPHRRSRENPARPGRRARRHSPVRRKSPPRKFLFPSSSPPLPRCPSPRPPRRPRRRSPSLSQNPSKSSPSLNRSRPPKRPSPRPSRTSPPWRNPSFTRWSAPRRCSRRSPPRRSCAGSPPSRPGWDAWWPSPTDGGVETAAGARERRNNWR